MLFMTRWTSFIRTSDYRAREQLGLIHTYLCGPFTYDSLLEKGILFSSLIIFQGKPMCISSRRFPMCISSRRNLR